MTWNHYDEVLYEAKRKGEETANKYIFELYTILRDEEHLPPEDCRARIEHDCVDLWSKATIRKFLPEEAKNPKKSKAGKIRAERKKKLEEEEKLKTPQLIGQTTDGGNIITTNTSADNDSSSSGARIDLAENDSFGQEKEESRRFHTELSQKLGERTPPELIEAMKIISLKDQRIKEQDDLINSNTQTNPELFLPAKVARGIHDIIDINKAVGSMTETDFILRHDGRQIVEVESLNGADSNSRASK